MDKKDEIILNTLKENAKLSTQQISKRTRVPITTVHHRIKKLEKEGIIKGYTTILDNKKIGKPIAAYVLITVDYNILKQKTITQEDLALKLKSLDPVEESAIVAGGTDILIKVREKDIDRLNDFVVKELRNIDAIDKTQTMVILKEL